MRGSVNEWYRCTRAARQLRLAPAYDTAVEQTAILGSDL